MGFKQFLESVDGYRQYTVENLLAYHLYRISRDKLPKVKNMLKNKGWYDMGCRVVSPVIVEDDEIYRKAKEIYSDPHVSLIDGIQKLRGWSKTIPESKLKSMGYVNDSSYDKGRISLKDAQAIGIKNYYLYIIVPKASFPNVNDMVGRYMYDQKIESRYSPFFEFLTESHRLGINSYKEIENFYGLSKDINNKWDEFLDIL